MADVNGRNYAITQQEKERKIAPGELGGELQVLTEDLQLAATLAVGEKLLGPKLPEGALIHDAWVSVDAATPGATRLNLGNAEVLDSDGVTVLHAADPNSMVDAADLSAAAGRAKSGGDEAFIQFPLKTLGEMQVQLEISGADLTGSPKLGFTVLYSVP